MTTGQKMFLLAAREMNFSRAAEIAYVTPQCLSDHIRRLEEQHGVAFFERKPRLKLTREGQAMLQYLSQMELLEEKLSNELADISAGSRGSLRVGMPTTRGNMLVPLLAPAFHKQFANVELQIRLADTNALLQLLREGKLDVVLAVNAPNEPDLELDYRHKEGLYLVMPLPLMERCFGQNTPVMRERFLQRGADLTLMGDTPFVLGGSISTASTALQRHLTVKRAQLNTALRISSFSAAMRLCQSGKYATVSSQGYLELLGDPKDLFVCPVADCGDVLQTEIVCRAGEKKLAYQEAFEEMLRRELENSHRNCLQWLKGIEAHK